MRKVIFVYCLMWLTLPFALSAGAEDLTGRQVIERSVKAMGGVETLEKMQSRTASAKVEVRGLSGTFEIWSKAPDRMKTVLDLGVIRQERGFDGVKGWQKQTSLEEIGGAELERLKRSAQFQPLLTYYKNSTPAELKGKEKLNETDVYRVEIQPSPEVTETFYFDANTFLPVREVRPVIINMQKTDLVIDSSDYRKVNGIQLPFKSVQVTGDQVLTLVYDAYHVNPAIDDKIFKSPAEQHASEPYEVNLFTIPEKVYKENDGIWEPAATESWYFHVGIREKHGRSLNPVAARIEFFADDEKLEFVEIASEALETMRGAQFGTFSGVEEVFHLTHSFSRPAAAAVDKMVYRINLVSPTGEKFQRSIDIPVLSYEQKSRLIFPLKGNFLIGAGHDVQEPHKQERSQHYAYDILALGPNYELLSGGRGSENSHFVTFGKELLATAAGKIAYARNDVPDNAVPGKVDTEVFMKLPDPERAVLGNSVVIDHGNGEFSLYAHLKFGSVRVKEGDSVQQGDVIGLLGNSGNSDAPHLHYQLMAGPRAFRSDGLPSSFENVWIRLLATENAKVEIPRRGVYLTAE